MLPPNPSGVLRGNPARVEGNGASLARDRGQHDAEYATESRKHHCLTHCHVEHLGRLAPRAAATAICCCGLLLVRAEDL